LNSLIFLFAAMAISIGIIPIAMQLAPRLGMLDQPDARKVHAEAIPRIGGAGIVIGTIVPILLWVPFDAPVIAYVIGATTLFLFGVWDDARELPPYSKFIGQFVAAAAVVYGGDVFVINFPMLSEPLPEGIGRAFSVFALVGIINATNVADGLDGLAAGLSVLSLLAMGFLAFDAGGNQALSMILATVGGVFGFLRYNTHPARVFMGDGGSQFLGFSLGFFAIQLTQTVNPALSPSVALLVLGLPVTDMLVVMYRRRRRGVSMFGADRGHVHHRLLDMGLYHYEAVSVIYLVQTILVASALLLRYQYDSAGILFYFLICGGLFVFLAFGARCGLKRSREPISSSLTSKLRIIRERLRAGQILERLLTLLISFLLVATSLLADAIPSDIGIASGVLLGVLLIAMATKSNSRHLILRVILFVTTSIVIYLESRYLGPSLPWHLIAGIAFYGGIGLITVIGIQLARQAEFRTTPTDLLVLFAALGAGALAYYQPERLGAATMAVKVVIVFYALELLFSQSPARLGALGWSSAIALAAMVTRAVL
jgi:UDP-GlcNAc:undecaprenyl-phosphate GlcNAc-1-phosphate transferase